MSNNTGRDGLSDERIAEIAHAARVDGVGASPHAAPAADAVREAATKLLASLDNHMHAADNGGLAVSKIWQHVVDAEIDQLRAALAAPPVPAPHPEVGEVPPPLPELGWSMLCTKCGYTAKTDAPSDPALREALAELRDRIKAHPAYACLTEDEVCNRTGHPKEKADMTTPVDMTDTERDGLSNERLRDFAAEAGACFDKHYKGEVIFISRDALRRFSLAIEREARSSAGADAKDKQEHEGLENDCHRFANELASPGDALFRERKLSELHTAIERLAAQQPFGEHFPKRPTWCSKCEAIRAQQEGTPS